MIVVERSMICDNSLQRISDEISNRSLGRQVQIISDFDETQCSRYVYSNKWRTHVPKIRSDLVDEVAKLKFPMCIATGRGAREEVSWVVWNKLSRLPMPLVAENGAVIVWPKERFGRIHREVLLATRDELLVLSEIREKLRGALINKIEMPIGHELILRGGRLVAIELRAQDIKSKKGTPEDYVSVKEQLEDRFADIINCVDIVSSGNSLGIQPKGLDKERGIRIALASADVNLNDIFLVGIGDNMNDEPLFRFVHQQDGLNIGVGPMVNGRCDFVFDGGDEISLKILKAVNSI